jgi:hypothetical protein
LVDADNAYAESENARVSIAFHAQPKVAARLPTVQDVACLAKGVRGFGVERAHQTRHVAPESREP